MQECILKIEQQLLSLKRDVNQVREVAAELVIGQSQNELAFIQIRNTLDEHEQKLNRLATLSGELLAQFLLLREQTFQNTENPLFLVQKHGALTDQVNRLEEELGQVNRAVFEHTILLNNLRRDVEELKTDVAEIKSDVTELKTDLAELKASVGGLNEKVDRLELGQTQILEAIQNLKN